MIDSVSGSPPVAGECLSDSDTCRDLRMVEKGERREDFERGELSRNRFYGKSPCRVKMNAFFRIKDGENCQWSSNFCRSDLRELAFRG